MMTKKPKLQRRENAKTPGPGWDEAEIVLDPKDQGFSAPRFFDWKARLVGYLAGSTTTPFAYGRFDCALFTLGAVAVMTGVDLAAPYRDRYGTLPQGIALLRRDGLRDHVDLIARHFAEVPPCMAQAGDIAVVDGAEGPALGLVQGEYIYALLPTGMALVPLLSATRAFRVA